MQLKGREVFLQKEKLDPSHPPIAKKTFGFQKTPAW